ncbi:helix-turn-helix domain-containing protein [Caldovatus aquaticus]|uniref:Helix-turn-helix domain-containing protein n=1 Tax=Caldovatus aquaticus TaxID=2865671 RepID=A0ABS7F629_9PROT|nr:helix-turn-helix transcriptional regulator [Caldovatus aquaticus]MBW8271081.1 helix-turn-helix domain-containing protein [Caldovatus aquaticus]
MPTTTETEPPRATRGAAQAGGQAGEKPGQRASAADRHVGARIRERRIMMGLSQQQLAKMIGVTYQQAHKYERGLNRISAGRLFEIAQVLGVPVSWFFEGLGEAGPAQEMTPRQRMCLELARNFALIDNEKHQEALSQMARALAAQSQAAGGAAAQERDKQPPAGGRH